MYSNWYTLTKSFHMLPSKGILDVRMTINGYGFNLYRNEGSRLPPVERVPDLIINRGPLSARYADCVHCQSIQIWALKVEIALQGNTA